MRPGFFCFFFSFFLITRHRRATAHFDAAVCDEAECIADKKRNVWRAKEAWKAKFDLGKYIYICREKISCVNPIVEHFSFTV